MLRSGQVLSLEGSAELRLEDGTVLQVGMALSPALPLRYHELRVLDGGPLSTSS
jgi:hypothetical protein